MFRNPNVSQGQPSLIQRVFLAQCDRAMGVPFVPPSEQVLDDSLTIMNLYPEAMAHMPGPVDKDFLLQLERGLIYRMYDSCKMVINSPEFDQLISSLKLTAQQATLLNMRQLSSLLTIEMAAQVNQSSFLPASPASVALLLERLNSIGISFEMLASIEYKKFELIVSGANQLLKLSDNGLPLNNLLELRYINAWALIMPSAENEDTLITTNRQQAIELLSADAPRNKI